MSSTNPGNSGAAVAATATAAAAADSSSSETISSSSSQQAKKRKAVTVDSPTSTVHSTAKTADEKKWDRVLANRRSAKESRERRKKLLTDLEESVERLKTENSSLAQENASLRTQLQNALASNNRTAAEAALAGAANPHLARSIAAGLLLQSPGAVALPSAPSRPTTLLACNALNPPAVMTTTGNANVLTALAAATLSAPNNVQSASSSISNSFGSAALPAPAARLNLSSNALLAQLAALQQNQAPQQLNVSAERPPVLTAQQPQASFPSASDLSGALTLAARTSPPSETVLEEQKQGQQ